MSTGVAILDLNNLNILQKKEKTVTVFYMWLGQRTFRIISIIFAVITILAMVAFLFIPLL